MSGAGKGARGVPVYFSADYVLAAQSFDTTRKARWVADSLRDRPIAGIFLEEPAAATVDELRLVHDAAYVEAIRTGEPGWLARSNHFDWDPGLWAMTRASTGGAVAAALRALASGGVAGSLSSGLHHAKRACGDGFCTFNGLALAARRALEAGAGRVLILDLDAHCGGGTADILARDPRVASVDIAVNPFDEYAPDGERFTLDLVRDASAYLPTLRRRLDALEPATFDLVLYNAGMDPCERSAIGGLPGITDEILARREATVFDWCRTHGLPVAFVLAGGYVSGSLTQGGLVDLHRLTLIAAAAGTASDI